MTIREWWRKQSARRRYAARLKTPNEAGIAARVDMVRFEALGEAAYDAMYEARLYGAKDKFDDAQRCFDRAIDAARRSGLLEEVTRLTRRRDHVAKIYNSQFRFSAD